MLLKPVADGSCLPDDTTQHRRHEKESGLQSAGWEETLAKYKPKATVSTTTVGAFLDAVTRSRMSEKSKQLNL